MVRKSVREFITLQEVYKHDSGWFEDILYDADLSTKQEYLEVDKDIARYLFLIYPSQIEAQK